MTENPKYEYSPWMEADFPPAWTGRIKDWRSFGYCGVTILYVCGNGLRKFFDVPGHVQYIRLALSRSRSKDAVKVRVLELRPRPFISVSGERIYVDHTLYRFIARRAKTHPYLSVEYKEQEA